MLLCEDSETNFWTFVLCVSNCVEYIYVKFIYVSSEQRMAYLTAAAVATISYAIALLAILLGVREINSTSTVAPDDGGESNT